MKNIAITTIELRFEQDVVLARQRARQIAQLLGFHSRDLTRISTAVSEIARNAYQYAQKGRVRFIVEDGSPPLFTVATEDQGPGIDDIPSILEGQYQSTTGLGMGICGAQRLMDRFEILCEPGRGTVVRMSKELPQTAVPWTEANIGKVAAELATCNPESPYEELQRQNQELLRSLDEIGRLNRELEATNRGVVALYAELDEHADYLRRANELKTSFLSNMSHEFRTPLNAIESISRLLFERTDGPLTPEQDKQVSLIRTATRGLSELVNDLLDLAKVEAGKVNLQIDTFQIADLFNSLKGMLRPLLAHNSSVELIFEAPAGFPDLRTDDQKVAQILRNFISNALKFTEKGEVRVGVECGPGDSVIFSVRDTGIGIAHDDQERIFEEFVQVENVHQRRHRGTGLGLSLCRKLAGLLRGDVSVKSEQGRGSTFSLVIPRVFSGASREGAVSENVFPERTPAIEKDRVPILVIEDNLEALFIYGKHLENTRYQMIAVQRLAEARRAMSHYLPAAILLDLILETENTWEFLAQIKSDKATSHIPVVVVTVIDNERQAVALGADGFGVKPTTRTWLIETLDRLTTGRTPEQLHSYA